MLRPLLAYLRRHHIGLLALVVALGGTAYAANTVGSRDVVDDSLQSKDVRNKTLRGKDVKPDSLKGTQIKEAGLDTGISSGTVVNDNGTPLLLDPVGFKSVRRIGTGQYQLTLKSGADYCNGGGAFLTGDQDVGGAGGSIGVDEEGGNTVTVVVRDSVGKLSDLGAGLGNFGFSIISSCPL